MGRAIRSRFCSSVSGTKFSLFNSWSFTRGPALDALFVFWPLENRIHKNSRFMHLIGVELAELDELFDFGADVIGGRCPHGAKVARGVAIANLTPTAPLPPL